MTNWKNIHPDFTPELQKEWEERGFDYEECRNWIDTGLRVKDFDYCVWLKDEKKLVFEWFSVLDCEDKKQLMKDYSNRGEMRENDSIFEEKKTNIRQKNINAQEYIDKKYPKEIRNKIKNLCIREKELEGSLDLCDFVNLEKLDCAYNQLTDLKLTGLVNLEKIQCSDNYLKSLDYSYLDSKKLYYLSVRNNNFSSKNLSIFSRFVNLEFLWIGNSNEEKIKRDVYNRFYGSLKPLERMNKLLRLNIDNTDINSGVDYLPDCIEQIYYSSKEKPESKVKEIEEELVSRVVKKNWKDIHEDLVEWKQREWENLRFNRHEVKKWIEAGLQHSDYHFAAWLRWKGYNPQQNLNWEKMGEESRGVWEWLDREYPLEIKKWVTWIDISKNGLEGELTIEDFPNLEILDCSNNQFTSLFINNLPKLIRLDAYENRLTKLDIKKCPEIKRLEIRRNHLSKLDFLENLNINSLWHLLISNNNFSPQDVIIFNKFKNLRHLWLAGNRFYGDLQSLKNLKKLENLTIADTEINRGFEYLSNSLRQVTSTYSQNLKKGTSDFRLVGKVESIKQKENNSEYHLVPCYDFKYWKESQPYFKWLKEELEEINPKLDVYEVLGNIFFNVKTGNFEGNLQNIVSLLQINKAFTDEKEKEIEILTLRVQELQQLIKQQKEKMVNAYLSFAPEKELLQKLVTAQLEFATASKQELDNIIEFRKKRDTYYYELVSKLSKRQIKEVEIILKDCEELATLEKELDNKFSNRLLSLKEQKQMTQLVVASNLETLEKRLQNHIKQQEKINFIKEKLNGKIKAIEEVYVFPTWFNDNCAIIINKENHEYNLWIVNYEDAFGKTEEKINYLKIIEMPPFKKRWGKIIEDFKKSLNSDYPAAEVHNNIYIRKLPSLVKKYGNVRMEEIKDTSLKNNPNNYLRPFDIVKIKKEKMFGMFKYQHVAIYLGKDKNGEHKVAHVNNPQGKGSSLTRIDNWETFLKDEIEIEIHHPFIPFKRPELVLEHVNIAEKAGYGKGKYNLLKSNCEHFATMCVYGLGMSRQKISTTNDITKKASYLLQAIEESNKFFKELEKITQDQDDTDSISSEIYSVIEISPKKYD